MLKDSCVVHSQQYRVAIYREYIEMFDGDACAAVLLWFFEFATNGEMARLRIAEENGVPWVKASVTSIVTDMMGLYATRSIYERLAWLKILGFLSVDKIGGGKINRYLLAFDYVEECLKTRKVFRLADCKIAASETDFAEIAVSKPEPDCAADCAADCKKDSQVPVLNLKEEKLRTKNNNGSFSTKPIDPTSARRIWETELPKLKPSERPDFAEQATDCGLTEVEFESAMGTFGPWVKSQNGDIRSPRAVFFKNPRRWVEDTPPRTDVETFLPPPVSRISGPATESPRPVAPAARQVPSGSPLPAPAITAPLDFDVWFERQYVRHPKKKSRTLAEQAAVKHFHAGKFTLEDFERRHALWCQTEGWKWKQGMGAPMLAEWIEDEGYRYDPAPDIPEGYETPGHKNPGLWM